MIRFSGDDRDDDHFDLPPVQLPSLHFSFFHQLPLIHFFISPEEAQKDKYVSLNYTLSAHLSAQHTIFMN